MKKVSITKVVSIISLFSSFTNLVPISVAISGFALIVYPFSVVNNRIPRAMVPLLALFSMAALSTLFYDSEAFFDVEFYRRDGNFFITMTPLLFLASSAFYIDLERTIRWFVYVVSFINFAVAAVWLGTGVALFRSLTGNGDVTELYHFLFIAHNAAGGFLAMLCAFSLALYLWRRGMLNALILAGNIVTLGLTNSRGSMLGLGCAVLLVLFSGRFRYRFYTFFIPILVINLIAALYIYSNSDLNYIIYRQTLITKVVTSLNPNIGGLIDDNISIRLETAWPVAVHAFFQSPIFGIGFGAYDDLPWDLWGWHGVFAFNSLDGPAVHSDAHAHHTYLHVMAEMGMVGLVLLIWFLNRLFRYLLTIESQFVQQTLLLSFWVAVVSSFTEHRLFTPSQMLPFVIMTGFAFAHSNYLQGMRRVTEAVAGRPALAAADR